jgi:DNA-binding SARP family transcriptional activator
MRAQPSQPLRREDVQSRLCLLGELRVDVGARTPRVPEGSKRLLVLLALHRRRVARRWAAGVLWPDGNDERAVGNLRSAIWRLRGAGLDVLDADKMCVKLADHVDVDVESVDAWAGRVLDGKADERDLCVHVGCVDALDLLPGWYDDWVVMSRERLRHRVLHALEALSRALSQRGRHNEAVDAAILAARLEPFRDSAQRVLIAAHLAEGNWMEAQRSCQVYVDSLQSDLGIEAPADLRDFMTRPWQFAAPRPTSPSAPTGHRASRAAAL